MAYRVAQQIDGFVGRWTGQDGVHWVVFASKDADPLRAFPPLPTGEANDLRREIDRSLLRHHSDLPEAKLKETTERVTKVSGQVAGRLRRST